MMQTSRKFDLWYSSSNPARISFASGLAIAQSSFSPAARRAWSTAGGGLTASAAGAGPTSACSPHVPLQQSSLAFDGGGDSVYPSLRGWLGRQSGQAFIPCLNSSAGWYQNQA